MKSEKLLTDFINYCKDYPEQRFWQALRNWSGASFIFYDESDTFYFEDRNNLSEKVHNISDKKGD